MEIQQLEAEVKRLESLLERQVAAHRRAARNSLLATSFLVALVLLFVGVNLINFRREFTEENIRRSLSKELQELSPIAAREFSLLGKDVLPAYAEEARRQIPKMGPQVSEKLEQEVDRLVEDVLAGTNQTLRDTESRLLARTEKILAERFPDFQGGGLQAEIERRFHGSLDRSMAGVLQEFLDRYGKDVKSIEEKLLKFDLSDSTETGLDLQKKFIHLWLQLLEEEIAAI
jgi:hypothetical protein